MVHCRISLFFSNRGILNRKLYLYFENSRSQRRFASHEIHWTSNMLLENEFIWNVLKDLKSYHFSSFKLLKFVRLRTVYCEMSWESYCFLVTGSWGVPWHESRSKWWYRGFDRWVGGEHEWQRSGNGSRCCQRHLYPQTQTQVRCLPV